MVEDLKLGYRVKDEPYRLSNFEGNSVTYGDGMVAFETPPIPVKILGEDDILNFDITKTGEHEVILGIPWLRRKNPRIDWVTGKMIL